MVPPATGISRDARSTPMCAALRRSASSEAIASRASAVTLRALCQTGAGVAGTLNVCPAPEPPMTTEELTLHIGRRLVHRRRELGLSLAQVSAKCGVSLQQIHRYEIGLNVVSAPRLWALSRCLGVPIGYFFEGLSEPSETRALSR